jgi:ATP-dependent exoDNAse (exonuclease V) beta subunit
MKGFLIFMAVLVGGCIYVFTHTHDLAQDAINKMKLEEGVADHAVYELLTHDPQAFATKYRPFVQQRNTIAKWASLVGETDLTVELSKETQERYDTTPLSSEPDYGDLIFRLAMILEDRGAGQEAYNLNKRYLELFPAGKYFTESAGSIQRLVTKYNIK